MAKEDKLMAELEKHPGTLKIEPNQPMLSKDIGILEYALLDFELWCLVEAFRSRNPMSTGDYYNQALLQVVSVHKEIEAKKTEVDMNIASPTKQFELSRKYHQMVAEHKKMLIGVTAQELREYEKELREKKIKFHSYKKVESTLTKLESLGFLNQRKEKSSKASRYWYINPTFLSRYGDAFITKFLN